MIGYTPAIKIGIDSFTRKVLITQLVISLELKRVAFEGLIDVFFSTEEKGAVRSLEKWLDNNEQRLDAILVEFVTQLTELVQFIHPTKAVGVEDITNIIYAAMATQRVLDDHIRQKKPKLKNLWLVEMNGYQSIVSAYSWNIAVRRYHWLKGKEHKSFVKLELSADELQEYSKLVDDNPWGYIPLGDNSPASGSVISSVPLYVPHKWHVDEIKIPEKILKEEDIRILKMKGEVEWKI